MSAQPRGRDLAQPARWSGRRRRRDSVGCHGRPRGGRAVVGPGHDRLCPGSGGGGDERGRALPGQSPGLAYEVARLVGQPCLAGGLSFWAWCTSRPQREAHIRTSTGNGGALKREHLASGYRSGAAWYPRAYRRGLPEGTRGPLTWANVACLRDRPAV